MFSKILVPVDGSENSFRALGHAVFLSKKIGSTIAAMTVIEKPPTVYVYSPKVLEDILSGYRKEAHKILEKCKSIATEESVEISTVIMEGEPAGSIIAFSKKEGFDTIVMGSRGVGSFKEMILGGTASKVLHHTDSAVIVIK